MLMKTIDDIRIEIELQIRNLVSYLADSGYLIVRPCGGFAEAGSAGCKKIGKTPV